MNDFRPYGPDALKNDAFATEATPRVVVLSLDALYPVDAFRAGVSRFIAENLADHTSASVPSLIRSLETSSVKAVGDSDLMLRLFVEEQGLPEEAYETVRALYRYYRPEDLELLDDAAAFLDRVDRTTRVCIISDGDGMVERRKIRVLGLAGRSDYTILTSDHGQAWRRPSNLAYSAVLKWFDVRPSEVLVVATNPLTDIEGALNCGSAVVRLRRGHPEHEGLVRWLEPVPEVASLDAVGQRWAVPTSPTL